VNQSDEVESIRHGRELAADSIPGKKESAIEHGDENAIEAPRNYNEVSVNGNNPLNSVSQSRGALQKMVGSLRLPDGRGVRRSMDIEYEEE